ncbi:hypothetical protein HPB47_014515 [Ixodes persulcatus]|uniref:Uncharacterized protein n=1 Tax=Ixodes persulcatus TaxID=34615 RepID=A0AC60QVV9_IXOPE|nr:hypothetical protein HPB47_014515 [Ixodes persulcatus]
MHGRERTNPSHSFGLHRVRIVPPSRLCLALHSSMVQKEIKVVEASVFSKEVDDALFNLLERERSAGHAVSNRRLSEEALKIASQLQPGNFLLVLDQAPIHKTQAAKDTIQERDTNLVYVRTGCTCLPQPADVFWNKSFMASLRRTWKAFMRKGEKTAKGNLRKPSRQGVLEFVYEALWHRKRARQSEEGDLHEQIADIATVVPENPDELRNDSVDLIFKSDSEESFDGFDSDYSE